MSIVIAYHGTKSAFSEFQAPAWFTPRRDFANLFAGDWGADECFDARSRLLTVRLQLENPLQTDDWEVTERLAFDPEWRAAQQRAGYDGVHFEKDGEVEYIIFRADQAEIIAVERAVAPGPSLTHVFAEEGFSL